MHLINQAFLIYRDAAKRPKIISTLSPVGTYERQSQFEGGTLELKKLQGDKFKFSLSSAYGVNVGELHGTLQLVNNSATCKEEGINFKFEYRGNSIRVIDQGSPNFGGAGVSAAGVYKKTDDKPPTMESE